MVFGGLNQYCHLGVEVLRDLLFGPNTLIIAHESRGTRLEPDDQIDCGSPQSR